MGYGPPFYVGRYVVVGDIPAGTRSAFVRYRGIGLNTVTLCNARIDADYAEPQGGFSPVEVAYIWEEDGVEKRNVHVTRSPNETWAIQVGSPPVMKGLALQLAP